MGRPRKQPRRIVTFNLNLPLAEAIDGLPVKNRSEWANKVLKKVIEDRDPAVQEEREEEALDRVAEIEDAFLESLLNNPERLALILRQSLIQGGFEDYKPKGRYPLTELLLDVVGGRPAGRLFPPANRGDEDAGGR